VATCLHSPTRPTVLPPPAISSGVALMVGLVKRLPYPWRSIVDAGVVAAARRNRSLGGATAGHPGLTPSAVSRGGTRAGMRPAGYITLTAAFRRARPFEGFQHQVSGLLWGAASIINLYVRALLGSPPGVDPCLPESK
jgi:hypothetical protein